jgi:hypothetical protein
MAAQINTHKDWMDVDKHFKLLQASSQSWNISDSATNIFQIRHLSSLCNVSRRICERKNQRLTQLIHSNQFASHLANVATELSDLFGQVQSTNTTGIFITETGTLTVTPNTLDIDFGTLLVGADDTTQSLLICNQSNSLLTVSLSIDEISEFKILSAPTFTAPAGYTFYLDIVLNKQRTEAHHMTTFHLRFHGIQQPVAVTLRALVREPRVDILTPQLSFGNVLAIPDQSHKRTVSIYNRLPVPLLLKTQIQAPNLSSRIRVGFFNVYSQK